MVLYLLIQLRYFCGRVPWLYQYWPGGFMLFVVLCPGTPEGSTGSDSGFKASQKTGQRLKVSSDRLGEAGNRTCDPWFTRHRFIPYTTAASLFDPDPVKMSQQKQNPNVYQTSDTQKIIFFLILSSYLEGLLNLM